MATGRAMREGIIRVLQITTPSRKLCKMSRYKCYITRKKSQWLIIIARGGCQPPSSCAERSLIGINSFLGDARC